MDNKKNPFSDNGTPSGVAVIGCGTVGGGTARILYKDIKEINHRCGTTLKLKKVVDLNHDHARKLGLPEELFETDYRKALADPEIHIIVELIGGTTLAKKVSEEALAAGKHVVTANKALLAHHGPRLFGLARDKGVSIGFEASCAGGIPIVKTLLDGLSANTIESLYGIVNGTCNYILTAMTQKGQSYQEALAEAQADGLAEADPTLDVSGMDSAHKVTILSSLAFQRAVDLDPIPCQGIDQLQAADVQAGQELGFIIKLLAIAQNREEGVSLRVRPAFIPNGHPLAWVSGPFNAVSVYGRAVGHTLYYGRGAGASPTASAVVSDIISVAQGILPALFQRMTLWPDLTEKANQLPSSEIESRYYLRFTVQDQPGVLTTLSGALGKRNISIASVLQKDTERLPENTAGGPKMVSLLITTHPCREGDVQAALKEIDAMEPVTGPSVCLDIIDEPIETIQ